MTTTEEKAAAGIEQDRGKDARTRLHFPPFAAALSLRHKQQENGCFTGGHQTKQTRWSETAGRGRQRPPPRGARPPLQAQHRPPRLSMLHGPAPTWLPRAVTAPSAAASATNAGAAAACARTCRVSARPWPGRGAARVRTQPGHPRSRRPGQRAAAAAARGVLVPSARANLRGKKKGNLPAKFGVQNNKGVARRPGRGRGQGERAGRAGRCAAHAPAAAGRASSQMCPRPPTQQLAEIKAKFRKLGLQICGTERPGDKALAAA